MNTVDQAPPIAPVPAMLLALCSNFGSMAMWRESFVAMADVHAGAAGRVELAFLPATATLVNRWVAGDASDDSTPLLAMTLPAPDHPEAFIAGIEWPLAYQRYTDAVHAASKPWAAQQVEVGEALLLDVRRAGVFEAATTQLPGATWRDPALVSAWASEMPVDREVVVYCVYGHEVGRVTAMSLRARGVNARFLEGGIDAWQSAGRRTVPKGGAS